MSIMTNFASRLTSRLLLTAGLTVLAMGAAHAAETAAPPEGEPPEVEAVKVFAPVGQAADVAPVKSSLKAT